MDRIEGKSVLVTQRQSKRKKRGRIKTAVLLCTAVILVYIICAIIVSVGNNLSTTTALKGTVSESFRTQGYVFRDQSIIASPASGYLECIVGEGERVKEGQTVGYIYAVKPDSAVIEQIKALNSRLQARGIDGEATVYSSDPALTEGQISDTVRDMSDKRAEFDLSFAADTKEKINMMIQGRSDDGENGGIMSADQIKAEISRLNAEAGSGRAITATAGGVFSTRVDGFEDVLGLNATAEITPSYIKELDARQVQTYDTAEAGQPLCKIVNNYTWCFASNVPQEEADKLAVGQSVKLEFFDLTNVPAEGTIKRISSAENGNKTIVVSTNKYVKGIYSSSRISADIVTVSAEGIKLPVECLHVLEGETGVYVVRLDVARFVPVNVRYKNSKWAIVSPKETDLGQYKLRIYDEVIVNCRNIENGKRVRR